MGTIKTDMSALQSQVDATSIKENNEEEQPKLESLNKQPESEPMKNLNVEKRTWIQKFDNLE